MFLSTHRRFNGSYLKRNYRLKLIEITERVTEELQRNYRGVTEECIKLLSLVNLALDSKK